MTCNIENIRPALNQGQGGETPMPSGLPLHHFLKKWVGIEENFRWFNAPNPLIIVPSSYYNDGSFNVVTQSWYHD